MVAYSLANGSCNDTIVVPSVIEVVGKDAVSTEDVTTSAKAEPCEEVVESEVSKEPVGTDAAIEAAVSTGAETGTETETNATKVELKAKVTNDEDVPTNAIASGAHQGPEGVSEDLIKKEETKRPLEDDATSESSKKSKSDK